MIERWFPCKEVSAAAKSGWGLGRAEKAIFTWFAARPPAQARAAVLTSLLPWPSEPVEQERLQELVRKAMASRDEDFDAIRSAILSECIRGGRVLDPFAGRGMIPLEAARAGLPADTVEYSPVATLAAELLVTFPFRDWSDEPALPYEAGILPGSQGRQRLLTDIELVLREVGHRYRTAMADFYPLVDERQPWGYLWATSLPCQECGRRFPLVGSYELRLPSSKGRRSGAGADQGQSFFIDSDASTGRFWAVVHKGPPKRPPTLSSSITASGKKSKGKSATCLFCGHVHALSVHQRLADEGLGEDVLLVAAESSPGGGKTYRAATESEMAAAAAASKALSTEASFGTLSAVPDERIPENNGATIRPQLYGARTYGDVMCGRQTLGFVRLTRAISDLGDELVSAGVSLDYAKALTGYAAAQLVRKLRYSTRGATLYVKNQQVSDVFLNEGAIAFSYDFFETGLGEGAGTWDSICTNALSTLRTLQAGQSAVATNVWRGTATSLPFRNESMDAVVTDPPYDSMVYYSDSSDLFYVWLKRSLLSLQPDFAVSSDVSGLQDKSKEIIVKEHGKSPTEHRDRQHYDAMISHAFGEMRRVVTGDGVVTIVFGHGEPEVWKRLLDAISQAGLIMTSSWPANTEAGGQQGKANITATLTMSCRPAPVNRPLGRKGTVEAEIKVVIRSRCSDWERWGLAPTDMLMAAAGPAMEIVGQYSEILDAKGDPVDIATFLPLARAAVQEAMAIEIDHHPLETFDARTRFALWWVRLFGRDVAPKSELRWQALAASMDLAEVRDLVPDADKGAQFVLASKFTPTITPESAVIDVALALAAVSDEGQQAMAQVLGASGRDPQDAYLWAAVKFLADRLPDSDPDSIAFNRLMRSRDGIAVAVQAIEVAELTCRRDDEERKRQEKLF